MKQSLLLSLFAFIVITIISSCELIDKPEPIPAYVQIDTMNVQIRQSSEGTSSHKIKDAWLFVNSQLVGAFQMPMVAPVLEEGEHTIEVFAGMADNGIVSLPEVYPFYSRYKTTRVLKAGETILIEPNITYNEDTEFAMNETFEVGNIFGQDLDGNPNTNMEIPSGNAFEGNRSAYIRLTDDNSIFEVATATAFDIFDDTKPTSPIYMELNYKNNMPFEVGIIGFKNGIESGKVYVTGFNPKDDWNKIYVNLTLDVSTMDADSYKLAIRAAKGNDVQIGEIFLDNIKLLHF